MTFNPKQLVVLDVNGLLADKIKHGEEKLEDTDDHVVTRTYTFVIRRGARKFVATLMSRYKVGIFSSTTEGNAGPVVKKVFGKRRPAFQWYRSRTKYDPDDSDGYSTVKVLDDVYRCPTVNQERHYKGKTTVIIDDDMKKLRFNDGSHCIIAGEYADDSSFYEGLLLEVDTLLSGKEEKKAQ